MAAKDELKIRQIYEVNTVYIDLTLRLWHIKLANPRYLLQVYLFWNKFNSFPSFFFYFRIHKNYANYSVQNLLILVKFNFIYE